MHDPIERQVAIDLLTERHCDICPYNDHRHNSQCCNECDYKEAMDDLEDVPAAQPERVWTPCDIPPEHHRDVIVRGVETISGKGVYKVMQWDVDTWRPTDYAPSIILLDWSEI